MRLKKCVMKRERARERERERVECARECMVHVYMSTETIAANNTLQPCERMNVPSLDHVVVFNVAG